MVSTENRSGGIVWIIAGIGLLTYATIGTLLQDIPGIEQLVAWLESLAGWWVLLAAFVAMFLEGLYFIGSFFPGTSIVVVLAVLTGGIDGGFFIALILTIFLAWCLAGVVNILLAERFRLAPNIEAVVEDRPLETWFPAFRANHEVAQVIAGAHRWRVFLSSVRVKLFGCLVFVAYGVLVPLFVDVTTLSNDQGFSTLFVVAAIMIGVGWYQLKVATDEH